MKDYFAYGEITVHATKFKYLCRRYGGEMEFFYENYGMETAEIFESDFETVFRREKRQGWSKKQKLT